MPESTGRSGPYKFDPVFSRAIAITAASVEVTGFTIGEVYRMTAAEAACVGRWGTVDAAPGFGSFDFAVGADDSIDVVCMNTVLNIEEASSASSATAVLLVQRVID